MYSGSNRIASREAIERRAYEIYIERGAVEGNDLSDWLAAEEELIAKSENIEVPDQPPTDLPESELRSTESRPITLRKSVSAS
jgi:hypothetical protein